MRKNQSSSAKGVSPKSSNTNELIDIEMMQNLINNNVERISLKQGVSLIGVSKATLWRRCFNGDYKVFHVDGNGGKQIEIDLQSILKKHNTLQNTVNYSKQRCFTDLQTFHDESFANRETPITDNNKCTYDVEIFLSLEESVTLLANLSEYSMATLRRKCQNGEYKWQWETGRGGKKMVVSLSSLPAEARAKYWAKKGIEDQVLYKDDLRVLESAPVYNRRQAEKYICIIRAADGLKGTALKQFIAAWNESHSENQTSYPRYLAALKLYKNVGASGLIGSWGNRSGSTIVADELFEYFKRTYLVEHGPSAESCVLETRGYALRTLGLDVDDFPTMRSFMYRLQREVPKDAIVLARHGQAFWNKRHGYYVDRTMNMPAGHIWFSDHRQLDVICFPDAVPPMARRQLRAFLKNSPTKRPERPWITVWRDMRTGLWLGWDIHMQPPNSDHILSALYNAITNYGVPKQLYIDNGKDYRARHFSGGRYQHKVVADEQRISSITAVLGIAVTFCWPFNPQAKTLERDFGSQAGWFDKRLRGYIGNNPVNRPEGAKKQIQSGDIVTFEQLQEMLDEFVEQVIAKMPSFGKTLKGRSRAEAWNEEFAGLPSVDAESLKMLCSAPSKPKQIRRNGLLDEAMGLWYYAEWMSGMQGRSVYMRRDPKQYQIGWIFDGETEEYLGRADLQTPVPGMAESELDKDDVRGMIRRRKKMEKIAQAYAEERGADELDRFENLKAGIRSGADPRKNNNNVAVFPSIRKTGTDDEQTTNGTVARFAWEENE